MVIVTIDIHAASDVKPLYILYPCEQVYRACLVVATDKEIGLQEH